MPQFLSELWVEIKDLFAPVFVKRSRVGWIFFTVAVLFVISDRLDSINSFFGKVSKMGDVFKFVVDVTRNPGVQASLFFVGVLWVGIAAIIASKSRSEHSQESPAITTYRHEVRVTYEEQTKIDAIMSGAPQVKVAVTTYSTRFSKALGDDTEGVVWFDDALRKAGVVTQVHLWQSFGAVPDGAHIWWAKSPQNNELVRRIREAALIKGFDLQEAPRGITKGFEIEIMVGRRYQQGALSESVQRDIEELAKADREKEVSAQQIERERRARLANMPRRTITWDQETEMMKVLSEFPIAPVAICMPMGDGDDYAIQLGRIFKQARINIGQAAIDLGDRFPIGVRIYWTPDGNNNRDAAIIVRAIEITGIRCRIAERQLSASLDILKEFHIHLYVGAMVTSPSPTPDKAI